MNPIEIARKLVGFGKTEDACKAYELTLSAVQKPTTDEKMEAAMYILQFGGDYKAAYSAFLELNHDGHYVEDTRSIMTEAFYLPNEKQMRSRYEKNCKLLKKYEYVFRKDFVPFDELPINFFPFEEGVYIPYSVEDGKFGTQTDYSEPVISRNFFKNLDDPILAEDVFSQYELEYLNDSVRPSEYVSRDNHIYLHYNSWAEFCSYLQVINLRKVLASKKFVFLIGDEISQYPIDFKERFGIDYSTFPLKPIGIREINRLIWHIQLSYHNGGDFFNEIFDNHPNLLALSSVMADSMDNVLEDIRSTLNDARNIQEVLEVFASDGWDNLDVVRELYYLRDRTDKDILVAAFCKKKSFQRGLNVTSRIAPAIFYQPHYSRIDTEIADSKYGKANVVSDQYETAMKSSVFANFKYIKAFAPMRRITTSYGASVKFMKDSSGPTENGKILCVSNEAADRIFYRGYLVDPDARVFKDCTLVRFEDGKLNPTATFTALAAFLDIPYTDSMTYCSFLNGEQDVEVEGNVKGFDPAAVYRTYDEYANDAERYYLEYFLRDAYEYYGYDFKYYDGHPIDEEKVCNLVDQFFTLDRLMRETIYPIAEKRVKEKRSKLEEEGVPVDNNRTVEQDSQELLDRYMEHEKQRRITIAKALLKGMSFVNKSGKPLKYMPKLELDPALLEQPLYH